MDESSRLTVTVAEAAAVLGIGKSLAYELVRTGQLPALRLGKRRVIARHVLEQMLTGGDQQ